MVEDVVLAAGRAEDDRGLAFAVPRLEVGSEHADDLGAVVRQGKHRDGAVSGHELDSADSCSARTLGDEDDRVGDEVASWLEDQRRAPCPGKSCREPSAMA